MARTSFAKETVLCLWQWNPRLGRWLSLRRVTASTAQEKLAAARRARPEGIFAVSLRAPTGKPSDTSP